MRLQAFAGRAQREKKLSLNSLGVRGAVSGRGRPTMRLKAFAGLFREEGGLLGGLKAFAGLLFLSLFLLSLFLMLSLLLLLLLSLLLFLMLSLLLSLLLFLLLSLLLSL